MALDLRILLVEPDSALRDRVSADLLGEGLEVRCLQRGGEVLPAMASADFDAVFLALRLPDQDGLDILPGIVAAHPGVPVIVITAYSSIASAVEAMRRGAADYLPKPFSKEQLLASVGRLVSTRELYQEVSRHKQRDMERYGVEAILGRAPLVQSLRDHIRKISGSRASTVLVLGESGVGKDLVARALHVSGPRAPHPFVAVNCAAIPESLLESELFGFEPGAFTGATRTKRGLFETADRGTVFLDEIGDLDLGLQAKLLRFTEEQRLRRLGGTRDIEVDVRVVAATNMNLGTAVDRGRFREDLYYRLMIVPLFVPPLRERREDIPLLVPHFLDMFNKRFRKAFERVSPEAMESLTAHEWPGNVRELRNLIERLVLLEEGPCIEARMLPWASPGPPGAPPQREPRASPAPPEDDLHLERLELRALVRALERTGGNLSRSSRVLGISRDTVRSRMRRYGIRVETRVSVGSSPARALLGPAPEGGAAPEEPGRPAEGPTRRSPRAYP